jgi:hypothetical protein
LSGPAPRSTSERFSTRRQQAQHDARPVSRAGSTS